MPDDRNPMIAKQVALSALETNTAGADPHIADIGRDMVDIAFADGTEESPREWVALIAAGLRAASDALMAAIVAESAVHTAIEHGIDPRTLVGDGNPGTN